MHSSKDGKDLLRFITCGSVDDGKSTLIGRLLFDSQLLSDDQLSELGPRSVLGHPRACDQRFEVWRSDCGDRPSVDYMDIRRSCG